MNVVTEQTMSIEEMENLLFGNETMVDYNFTTVGHIRGFELEIFFELKINQLEKTDKV